MQKKAAIKPSVVDFNQREYTVINSKIPQLLMKIFKTSRAEINKLKDNTVCGKAEKGYH